MPHKCNIIAVFGISGVGKSTLIGGVIKDHPEYAHIQAGTLIKRALKDVPRDKLRLADPEKIIKNQSLLIEEFWNDIQEYGYSCVIFDGHSIIDTGKTLIEVPTDIIAALKPCKIIFVYDDPQNIHSRRKNDDTRKRSDASVDQIKDEQDRAMKQAECYATALDVPFASIKSGDLQAFIGHIG